MAESTWGDTVRVRAGAPVSLRPGALAAVVGIREIETTDQAEQFREAIGTKVYLVEFSDGAAIEISQAWLESVEA